MRKLHFYERTVRHENLYIADCAGVVMMQHKNFLIMAKVSRATPSHQSDIKKQKQIIKKKNVARKIKKNHVKLQFSLKKNQVESQSKQ